MQSERVFCDKNLMSQSNAHSGSYGDGHDLAFEALAQSGCGALVTDSEGSIVYVNSRLCEITGYSEVELLGKNPRILKSGNTPRETYLKLWNTVSAGRAWHGALENRKKNGELYWEAITISPLKDERGAITHFSAILEDITEETRLRIGDQELEAEIAQEEKRESLSTLAHGVAHDVNNSLCSVLSACDLARAAAADPVLLSQFLGYIEDAAKSGMEHLRRISNLFRPRITERRRFDAAEALRARFGDFERAVAPHPLHWKHEGEIAPINASLELLHEVVMALLENAREASVQEAIELCCRVEQLLKPGPEECFLPCGLGTLSVVCIEVKDAGQGMDGYTVRRAFNPYFSTHGHKGLGLAMVYGAMVAHQGAIGVVSAPGKGTEVKLYFPLSG